MQSIHREQLNFSIIALLYRMELRMILRDRRAVVMAVVMPLLIFPLMLWIMRFTATRQQHRQQEHTYTYTLTGAGTPELRALIRRCAARAGADKQGVHFKESSPTQPRQALDDGTLDLWVDVQPAKAGVPEIRLVYRMSETPSSIASMRMADALQLAQEEQRERGLRAHGLAVRLEQVGTVTEENVAPPQQLAGLALGKVLTPLLLFFLFTAGSLVATDTLAGEKERKTLETLLTTAVSRRAIILAKLLLIVTVTLVITCIQAANYAVYIVGRLIPLPVSLVGSLSLGKVAWLLVLYLPVVVLVSAILLLVSGYAKTYKEAQLYFTPVLLLGICIGLVALFPDTTLASLLALVPVANIALAVRDLLTGTLHWPLALLAWAVTSGAALWVGGKTTHLLASERLITAMEHDADIPLHGPARFPADVLRWFALLWALVVIAGNYLATPKWVPVQLLLNTLGFFLGGSLLLIRGYRLNIREALPLRRVRPLVWLAVLVAAPCAAIAGIGLEQLVNLVMPIPPEWLSNAELLQPLGHTPLWGQLLMLAVLPGICEEVAFRGVLLYGLRKSLRPAALAVTVGVVFALFHFLIFRLPTTAALGILLAAVTLLTGSLLPAICWHIINNSLAVLLGSTSLLDKPNPITYLTATTLLALAMYVIYRNRTGYPGLKR